MEREKCTDKRKHTSMQTCTQAVPAKLPKSNDAPNLTAVIIKKRTTLHKQHTRLVTQMNYSKRFMHSVTTTFHSSIQSVTHTIITHSKTMV